MPFFYRRKTALNKRQHNYTPLHSVFISVMKKQLWRHTCCGGGLLGWVGPVWVGWDLGRPSRPLAFPDGLPTCLLAVLRLGKACNWTLTCHSWVSLTSLFQKLLTFNRCFVPKYASKCNINKSSDKISQRKNIWEVFWVLCLSFAMLFMCMKTFFFKDLLLVTWSTSQFTGIPCSCPLHEEKWTTLPPFSYSQTSNYTIIYLFKRVKNAIQIGRASCRERV